MKTAVAALILSIVILLTATFILGMRWESTCIKNQLTETGTAITKYGDDDKIKIYGYFEEIK